VNRLKSKTVLITGASAGIGEATAKAFASYGANLILNARRDEKISKLADELIEEYGIRIKKLIFDVRNKEEIKSAIDSLEPEWQNIDILVNNAGMARGVNKIQDSEISDWEEMIDTNIKGLLYITRQVIPLMIARGGGHIINLGSIAGRQVYVGGNVYCATKFAVRAITEAIRIDTLENKIRVSTVDPGMVETEFSLVRFRGDAEKAKNVYKGLTPLTPEDIADAVIYCASRPAHVNISEMVITPLAQASAYYAVREG